MLVSMNPAVSSMRFGNGNNVNDILSRPGAFTRPESTNEPTVNVPAKKKSGYGKKVLKLVDTNILTWYNDTNVISNRNFYVN